MPHLPFISKDDLNKRCWEHIHFSMVWNDYHPFFRASIPPSSLYSIHPFLKTILVVNLQCGMELNEFRPSNSSDDLCLLFCLFLLLWIWGTLIPVLCTRLATSASLSISRGTSASSPSGQDAHQPQSPRYHPSPPPTVLHNKPCCRVRMPESNTRLLSA